MAASSLRIRDFLCATAAAAASGATGEPPPICSRRNIWRRQALRAGAPRTRLAGRRSAHAPGGQRHQAGGHFPDVCSTSVAGSVRKAKGRVLMASRYLPRRSAGKKAVALAVTLVIWAASGAVMVAAAGTAIADSASTTHATSTASPATGTSPRTRTGATPAASATTSHGTATVPPPRGGRQDHFGTSRPRISSGSHSPGDRPPAANADGCIHRNG